LITDATRSVNDDYRDWMSDMASDFVISCPSRNVSNVFANAGVLLFSCLRPWGVGARVSSDSRLLLCSVQLVRLEAFSHYITRPSPRLVLIQSHHAIAVLTVFSPLCFVTMANGNL
jgi:hypothetical protein